MKLWRRIYKGSAEPVNAHPWPHRFFHIRLQFSIIGAFVLLIVPSIIGIVWFVYNRNSNAMRRVADDSMAHASLAMVSECVDLLDGVGDMVDLLAGVGNADPQDLRKVQILPVLLDALRNSPQTYAFYAGFASDGAFNQALRLDGLRTFGPNDTPIPEGAKYVLRQLVRPVHGPPVDTYTYVSGDGTTVYRETAPEVRYDPRPRPFFEGAQASPTQRVTSDLYTFASSHKAGVTVSRGFGYARGRMAGAAAADITLDHMSEFLSRNTPGRHGIAIIVDDQGQIVAHPDPGRVVHREGAGFGFSKVTVLEDPRIRAAWAVHSGGNGLGRSIFTATDGKEYIASFTPFPSNLGTRWELLIVVPIDDFVGELKQATRQVLLVGLGVLLIVVIAIRALSAALTQSVTRLIEETQHIRQFELEGEFMLRSRITEIIHLTDAVQTLKTALRSFAKFMPRTLVRDLLTTGEGLALGGENRVITVMFTDLTNFSGLAEKVSALDLTLRISDYLEVVSQEVIRQHGTIDKYIGDSVMALWNAPILDPNHVERACLAALHTVRAFQESNERWAPKGWQPLELRLGLHTDSVVVGIIGSVEHMSYTALGDGVNIAARLESVNRVYGTTICASGAIYKVVADRFLMRPLDHVAVKGRREPILIYELMGTLANDSQIGATSEKHELARMTEVAFTAWMSKDVNRAKALYQALLERFPLDDVARLYVARCEQNSASPSLKSAAV